MAEPSPPLGARAHRRVLLAAAACLLPLLLQLPPTLGIGFGALALAVAAASWRRPLPGPLRLLLGLLVIAAVALVLPGLGRDSASAVLAGMLAVKSAETHRLRDGRSLLGFALFAPFATFLLDQGPLSLALGLLALVLAVLALQRLAADEAGIAAPAPAAELRAALRLLLLGLPLALAAFWLFPRLPAPLWGGLPERSGARPGLSDSMSPGQWQRLLNDDRPAARVRFAGAEPARDQLYWRGPVLWDFDGRTWRTLQGSIAEPAAPPRAGTPVYAYVLELEPTERHDLIGLDLPLQAPSGARLQLGHVLRSEQPLDAVSRWTLRSAPPGSIAQVLPPGLRAQALQLPAGYNPRTLALGRQWRREAGHDPDGRADAAIVARALAMIHRDFAYTLDVPLAGRNEVDDFLFERRAGYCEHFSSAFAVLMRAAGIPTRVVTGYAGGYRNPIGGYWLLRYSDAHAWNEVWLPRRGWVRVDPTAAVAPERVFDTLADRQPGRFGGFAGLAPVFDLGDWLRRGWNDWLLGFDAQRQQGLLAWVGVRRLSPDALIALFGALAAAAIAGMAWWLARGERERDPLLRAWHRLERRYRRRGLGRAAHEPAQAWAARVGADVPAAGQDLRTLSRRFSDARYAPGDPEAVPRLLRDLDAHRP